MKVLVAMSGGVDSSVAAALLVEQGHDVAGVTLRLWGGASDSGCCSVADVDDARRVAQQIGIAHYVFNFGDDFEEHVVAPYVRAHQEGRTPNPCIECNRHIKFDRLVRRADALGYEAIATGHHVRRAHLSDGTWAVRRGADGAKDQSYVVHMLGSDVLARCLFPVGSHVKADVRALASRLGLRTAAKPESMDVCFVAKAGGGRRAFLGSRIPLRHARVVDTSGDNVGTIDALELVTIGQRRGLGSEGGRERQYVVAIDPERAEVVIGSHAELLVREVELENVHWRGTARATAVLAQSSAHGDAHPAVFDPVTSTLRTELPRERVAPGQSVVLYDGDIVVGGGIAAPSDVGRDGR